MGTFTYDGTLRVDFDDRLLLHLQMVIVAKLRRDEPFLFTWNMPESEGGGRTSVWVDRTIPLAFEFAISEMPSVSRPWIEELNRTTFRMSGLQIVPDPGATSGVGALASS